jgi:hypothetical protein
MSSSSSAMMFPFLGCNHALRVFTRQALPKRGNEGNFALDMRRGVVVWTRVRPPVGLLPAIGCVVVPIGLLGAVVNRRRRSLQNNVFRTRMVYSRVAVG